MFAHKRTFVLYYRQAAHWRIGAGLGSAQTILPGASPSHAGRDSGPLTSGARSRERIARVPAISRKELVSRGRPHRCKAFNFGFRLCPECSYGDTALIQTVVAALCGCRCHLLLRASTGVLSPNGTSVSSDAALTRRVPGPARHTEKQPAPVSRSGLCDASTVTHGQSPNEDIRNRRRPRHHALAVSRESAATFP